MEDDPALQFDTAELDLLIPPQQSTLSSLYERARYAAAGYSRENGAMAGGTEPEVSEFGDITSLDIEHHVTPAYDSASRMRLGVTLRVESLIPSEGCPTGTYDIWWREDRNLDIGIYFELRRRKVTPDEGDTVYSGSTPCYELDAQNLLSKLPDHTALTQETRVQQNAATGLGPQSIARTFGALGIFNQ